MEEVNISPQNANVTGGFFDKKIGNIDFRFGPKHEVVTNRKRMMNQLKVDLKDLYEMEQVHGSHVTILRKTQLVKNIIPQTDALVTNLPGVLLMIKTADCFPVLFSDPKLGVVAAIHVGWRGAMQKVFLETLLVMINHFGSKPGHILATIGPGARKCCFIHQHFVQEKLPEWQLFIEQKNGRKALDIPSFIIDKLAKYGVKKENIEDIGICTVCNKNYFSHFRSLRENEVEGRMAAVIGLKT